MPRSLISARSAATVAVSALTLASGALLAPVAFAGKAQHASGRQVKVTVKAIGKPPAEKTLLDRTVLLSAAALKRGGHSCSGLSAAAALQDATRGRWAGTWDAQYSDWEVTRIAGTSLPFKSKAAANWYWSLYVGGKEASAGVCEEMPSSGQTVVFKAACYGKSCPKAKKKPSVSSNYAEKAR
ncbi:MAG: hypothetical protein ACYCUM_04355 [Solirubrobacteraceae bacterium]